MHRLKDLREQLIELLRLRRVARCDELVRQPTELGAESAEFVDDGRGCLCSSRSRDRAERGLPHISRGWPAAQPSVVDDDRPLLITEANLSWLAACGVRLRHR